MLIGIDVGGTYTDAVLIKEQKVIEWVKVPTRTELLSSLLEALDKIMEGINPVEVKRIVLSTTLITNLIAEEKVEPVALIAIPGPGTNPANFAVFQDAYLIKGAIDYRGREIEQLDLQEVKDAVKQIDRKGIRKVAVTGKFSVRNNAHENEVARYIKENYPHLEVELGHKVAGKLNFPRRAATTRLTAATRPEYRNFVEKVRTALKKRKLDAPVYILKADGGTLPLKHAVEAPVETIFSGPAASTMGVMGLTPRGQTSVVVDIGGTTTDLALILSGKPLLSSKGARVKEHLTQVRAFATKSIAVGGDSVVGVENQQIFVGTYRLGPAKCVGGPAPTPTDALRVLGLTDLGDEKLARQAMSEICGQLPKDPSVQGDRIENTARHVLGLVVGRIVQEIKAMFLEWEQEPAYRIWELMQKEKVRPQNVVGIGGAAASLVPLVAEQLDCQGIVPQEAPVANAVGAAISRPTMSVTLRVDTAQAVFTVAEDGTQGKLKSPGKYHLEETEKLARELLEKRAEKMGLVEYSQEAETIHKEVFNMIRGWNRIGRIVDVVVQIPTGIISEWNY